MNKAEFIKKYNLKEIKKEDGFVIDIVYATEKNFTKQILYKEPICMLRENTVKKLLAANRELNGFGFKIKILDTFRTIICQEKMWELYPNEKFVTNPNKGNSNHCKASAIDISLCTLDDKEVEMPTEFDHFGVESYREYYKKSETEAKNNALLLENVMLKHGFKPFKYEWWHFDDIEEYELIYEDFE